MSYVAEWASALADVAEAGSAVTFTSPASGGTYNTSTGTVDGGSSSSVAGQAMRVRGNPLRYQALQLIEADAPTLLFVSSVYGQLPTLDMNVVWGGQPYNVKDIAPVDLDGNGAVVARIVVAR